MVCPNCGGKHRKETAVIGVFECQKCGAIFGHAFELVQPFFTTENLPLEKTRYYYDLECLGSNGIERRHGWFDPVTKLIVQVG
jgi:hypothetical protein